MPSANIYANQEYRGPIPVFENPATVLDFVHRSLPNALEMWVAEVKSVFPNQQVNSPNGPIDGVVLHLYPGTGPVIGSKFALSAGDAKNFARAAGYTDSMSLCNDLVAVYMPVGVPIKDLDAIVTFVALDKWNHKNPSA